MVEVETILQSLKPASARGSDLETRAGAVEGRLAKRASDFLLDLYAISRTSDIGHFQQTTLLRLRSEIPFTSAFWGMMRIGTQGEPTLHSIFAEALPVDFVREWETVKHGDELAALVLDRPGVVFDIRTADMNDRSFAAVVDRAGISTATSIAVPSPVPQLRTFLSLFRPAGASQFDLEDHYLQEFIMPHIAAAWHANRLQQLERWQAGRNGLHDAFAVSDKYGRLHACGEAFSALLRAEWPTWSGEDLPAELGDVVKNNQRYDGVRLSVEVSIRDDLVFLHAHRRTALDTLSPRETVISEQYRDGLSYKEIAKRLDCSPYTIRHHLRTIYGKLEIGDKTALIHLMGNVRSPEA